MRSPSWLAIISESVKVTAAFWLNWELAAKEAEEMDSTSSIITTRIGEVKICVFIVSASMSEMNRGEASWPTTLFTFPISLNRP